MSFEHERTMEAQDSSSYQISDSFLEAIRTAPSGEPETFGATPLNHAAAYEQQYSLRVTLAELLEDDFPEGIPDAIVEYMKDTFASRFIGRGTANQENYLSSLRSREELDDDPFLQDMVTRAELGHASPSELLVVQQLLGIRSVELACLTHPYGKKIELLEPMRYAVGENIKMLGGEHFENPEARYRVKGFAGEWGDYSQGVLMTRKRIIGTMPDGTIICERSSFVLRLDDESVVSKSTLEAITTAVAKLDGKTNDWQHEAVIAGNLDDITTELLGNNVFSHAIPVSTTVYAYNLETGQLVKEKAAKERAIRSEAEKLHFESRYPSILEAIKAAREERALSKRTVKDIDGMLYVGHEDEDFSSDSAL